MNERERFRRAFVLLLLVFISAGFVAMIRQFLVTILLAAIFTGLARPIYGRFLRLLRGRPALASLATLLLILLVVIVPLSLFLGAVAGEALTISQAVGPWIQKQISQPDALAGFLEKLPFYEHIQPYRAEIITRVGQLVGAVGNFLVRALSATTRGTISFFFHLFILLYTMFFFLMHGGRTLEKVLSYLPLTEEDEARLVDHFVSISRATLKGTLIIGVVQGGLAGAAFALAGIPGAIFWGTLMMLLSIIPGVGAGLVWVPAAIYLFATGDVAKAVLLTIWCGLVVGSADNLLRPRLVGRDTKMPELMIFFSSLGGIMLFGLVGFIVGPILAGLFLTIWEIYGSVFSDVLRRRPPGDETANHAS